MDFSKLKKDISLFLTSEEAKVLKKDVARLGLTASAIAMIMAQQVRDAAAQAHDDAHYDSTSHADHTSHTDGLNHTDGHGNHTNHGDHTNGTHTNHDNGGMHGDHPNGAISTHTSVAAPYDSVNRRGGHNSTETFVPNHTDS